MFNQTATTTTTTDAAGGRGAEPEMKVQAAHPARSRRPYHRPSFPARFETIEAARSFCREFFAWYNTKHRHCGIGLMTPQAVHYGRAAELRAGRARVLAAAYAVRPQRFVNDPPKPPELPTAAWINRPTTEDLP
jgi:hypothetical protein